MPGSEPITQHLERLLARVEQMQQAVSQLYVELQAVHRYLGAAPQATAAASEVPMAIPLAAPADSSFYSLRPMDRRTSPRRQVNQILIAISSALDDSKPFTGWVLDYSSHGLGVFVDRKMPLGTELRIRPSQVDGFPGREAVVRNCQPYLDGWRLGCQLEQAFSRDDLLRFGLEK